MELTRPAPVSSDKKKPDEVGLDLAAIRQSTDIMEGRIHKERSEHEEIEVVQEKDQWEALLPKQNHEQEIPTRPYNVQQSDRFDKLMTYCQERVLAETRCPFHRSEELKALTPDYYYICPVENCPVWLSIEIKHEVLKELRQNTHPEVRAKITSFFCHCCCVPRMKLSRTKKNFHRVFLTCGQVDPCRYFQWMHEPLWKPKSPSLWMSSRQSNL